MNEQELPKKNNHKNDQVPVKEKKKKDGKVHKLLEQNELLQKQNEALNEKVLRLSAEMQNMRRHFDEDKMRLLKYDGEKVIMELLPIIDNFERAFIQDDSNLNDEVSKFLSGFKMIYSNFLDLLKNLEVKEIECIGKPFDSAVCNAVLVDHENDKEDNIVLDCMQKGYLYKDKLIRPAMVKVNNKESDK